MIARLFTAPARSTALKLGGLIAGVFLVANVAAFGFAYAISLEQLRDRARTDVMNEVATFVAVHQSGGIAAVAGQIVLRAQKGRPGPDLVFLSPEGGADAGRAAGNVRIARTFTGWRTLSGGDMAPAGAMELAQEYIAYGTIMDGHALIVGQSTDALDELAEIFARSFLIGLGISMLASVLATLGFVWRAEARIAAIASTLDAVAAGGYERRVPVWPRNADDLARIGRSINTMLDRLAANVSGLRQVSADIAHDLKTPIQRLRGTLEAMRGKPVDEDAVEDAIAQTDTIARTFQALLRIAQIEGGSPRARFQPTDLAEVCAAVAEAFQPAVEDAGHRFAANLPQGPAMVRGDRDLLAQALSNLLENAIRHAPAPSDIAIALTEGDGEARITVSDTGPGIPEEEREKVFRRLYRLERSRTTEGNGLGLALVAAVAELHGGAARMEGAAPGLRAILTVPLAPRGG
ncbi:MAG: signal transduction histidine kinase [Paracoccaceae bacterium]